MTIGIAQFVRVYSGPTTFARWQNFWPLHVVDLYSHAVFEASSIESSVGGQEITTTIEFGFVASIRSVLTAAVAAGHLVEISFYSFTPTADGSPPAVKTLYTQHIGQAMQLSENSASMLLTVGDGLSPAQPQMPPRIYTTALIGVPCQL